MQSEDARAGLADLNEIPFTQYMLPRGERKQIGLPVSDAAYAKAREIMNADLSFEIEVLRTGHVSATITDPEHGDLDIVVTGNGPGVREAVERMIARFDHAAALAALEDEGE